jgi:hypothetical protein
MSQSLFGGPIRFEEVPQTDRPRRERVSALDELPGGSAPSLSGIRIDALNRKARAKCFPWKGFAVWQALRNSWNQMSFGDRIDRNNRKSWWPAN